MSNEKEILESCNMLFVTMTNVHIDGKPMADLLKLYEQTKEELDKLKEIEEEHQKENGSLRIEINKLNNEKTCVSVREYYELLDGLKSYKNIKELKPIAEIMEREINRLNIWA